MDRRVFGSFAVDLPQDSQKQWVVTKIPKQHPLANEPFTMTIISNELRQKNDTKVIYKKELDILLETHNNEHKSLSNTAYLERNRAGA
jgi:hypothetical protein